MPPKKNPAVRSQTPNLKRPVHALGKNAASLPQAALRLGEDKFEFMFDHSIVAKSFSLPSGGMTPTQAFCDLLGYSQAELQNKKWQEITHPKLITILMTAYAADELIQQGMAEGIKTVLTKPIDIDFLIPLLSTYEKRKSTGN